MRGRSLRPHVLPGRPVPGGEHLVTVGELPGQWRGDAALLEAYGDTRGAAAARLHADQLAAALRVDSDRLLSLAEAARESGYSKRRLRELVAEGKLANHGRKHSPRFRKGDLPRKTARPGVPFDARTEARTFLAER